MGGRSPLTSSNRCRLNQSTQCSVVASTCSTVRQGPRRRMSSVLNRPITDSANALSSASPTLPTEASIPAAGRRSVNAIETSHASNLSSGGCCWVGTDLGEGGALVVLRAGGETVMQDADHAIEQVALGGDVAVTG